MQMFDKVIRVFLIRSFLLIHSLTKCWKMDKGKKKFGKKVEKNKTRRQSYKWNLVFKKVQISLHFLNDALHLCKLNNAFVMILIRVMYRQEMSD